MLERINRVNAGIDELTAVIERLLAPYEEQLQCIRRAVGRSNRGSKNCLVTAAGRQRNERLSNQVSHNRHR